MCRTKARKIKKKKSLPNLRLDQALSKYAHERPNDKTLVEAIELLLLLIEPYKLRVTEAQLKFIINLIKLAAEDQVLGRVNHLAIAEIFRFFAALSTLAANNLSVHH